jgi:hypothetical protein
MLHHPFASLIPVHKEEILVENREMPILYKHLKLLARNPPVKGGIVLLKNITIHEISQP